MNVVLRCVLLTLFLATAESRATAQILKNPFGREQRKPVRRPPNNTATTSPRLLAPATSSPRRAASASPKPKPFEYPDTKRKPRYRVDVLVQLYLDELVKGTQSVYKVRIPEKAAAGMNFYEGIKLATDTLRDYYNLDIYIHDVTAIGKSPSQLTTNGSLDSSDLIIGAIPASQLLPVATFAKRRAVNFVSALSPADGGVRDNPYFTLLQPTLQTHCEWIAKAASRKFRNEKPLIIHRKSVAVDVSARRYLTGDDSASYTILDASAATRTGGLDAFLDQTGTNVLLVTVLDAGIADSILRSVARNYPGYTFEVYGMPTWRSISSFRKSDAFPNLAVNYTAPFYFDASTASGQSVAKAYQRTFGGKPGDVVYRAFETLHWYGYLLDRYGTVFNDNLSDAGSAGFTRFDVRPRYDRDASLLYNENKHLYLYRFQSGNFTVDQ
jgi:hypothetical protein